MPWALRMLLVVLAMAAGAATRPATAQPEAGLVEALRDARTVRIDVAQSFAYHERGAITGTPIPGYHLPFEELLADILVGAGLEPVQAGEAADAIVTVDAEGEALGALYFEQLKGYLYTGALLRGSVAFGVVGQTPYRIAFVGRVERQRNLERNLGYEEPENAPFDAALGAAGSYLDKTTEAIAALYGPDPLLAAILDGDPRIRPYAARVLGDLGEASAVPVLIDALDDRDPKLRWQAAWSLGRIGDEAAIEPLIDALDDRDGDVRWFAAWSLAEITGQELGGDPDAWQAWLGRQVRN